MRTCSPTLFLAAVVPALAAAVSAQGPLNREQIARVNLARTRIVAPAARLYGLAVEHCGGGKGEDELVDQAARLAGRAFAFSLVVIDPERYLADRRFKRRIDRAFDRMNEAARAVERLEKKVPAACRERLLSSWKAFQRAREAIARYWTGPKKVARKLRALELEAETTSTRAGDPVKLHVFGRYRDGTRAPLDSPDVAWVLRPDRGVTVNSAWEFLAYEGGIYQVTAVYRELTSPSVVIRVKRRPRAFQKLDLTGVFLGYKQNFAWVKAIACKVPDVAFDALRIRVLDRPARIGELKVYFADGTTQVLWAGHDAVLEPGEYLVGSFARKRRILRFDLRTQGEGGTYSRQALLGIQRQR